MHSREQPIRRCHSTLPYRRNGTAVDCENCELVGMCRVAGLEGPDPAAVDRLVTRRERFGAGKQLISANSRFGDIFAVKSGSFKSCIQLADGSEKIVDFHFPGELIGLDAIATGRYTVVVEAQEASTVCRLSFGKLHVLGNRLLEFQQHLVEALSRHARQEQWLPLLLGAQNADQRLALFLVSLVNRLAERGLASSAFRLPMSRTAIANYLGLAVETVSRTFQRFQRMGLLEVHGRRLVLHDDMQLRAIGGLAPLTQ